MENADYEEMFNVGVIPYNFHRSGRRTKCTAEVIQEIAVRIARDGSTQKDAALLSGISESVFYRWMARGRKEKARLEALGIEDEDDEKDRADFEELPFLELFDTINRAIPLRKALLVELIRKAGQDPRNWTALAWLLERLHPDEFGRKTRIEISKVPWREEVIDLIKSGIKYETVAAKVGDGEARELFERAGVEVPGNGTSDPDNGSS